MINVDEFVGAVRDGNVRKVEQYIGEGGDVNIEDKVTYWKWFNLVLNRLRRWTIINSAYNSCWSYKLYKIYLLINGILKLSFFTHDILLLYNSIAYVFILFIYCFTLFLFPV